MDGGVGICGIPVEMKAVSGSNGGDCGGVGICGIPVEMKAVSGSNGGDYGRWCWYMWHTCGNEGRWW